MLNIQTLWCASFCIELFIISTIPWMFRMVRSHTIRDIYLQTISRHLLNAFLISRIKSEQLRFVLIFEIATDILSVTLTCYRGKTDVDAFSHTHITCSTVSMDNHIMSSDRLSLPGVQRAGYFSTDQLSLTAIMLSGLDRWPDCGLLDSTIHQYASTRPAGLHKNRTHGRH